jgi:hypothetical protein
MSWGLVMPAPLSRDLRKRIVAAIRSAGGPGSLATAREAVFERVRDPNTFRPRRSPKSNRHKCLPRLATTMVKPTVGEQHPAFLHSVSKVVQYALLLGWKRARQADFIACAAETVDDPLVSGTSGRSHGGQ